MDKITIKGRLSLRFYNNGVLVKEDTGDNLIVSNGYAKLLSALSGTNDVGIEKIQAGTNGTSANSTDTAITNPIDITIISKVIANNKLTISFEFGAAQGNDTEISEFGIILKDTTLFSRKAWPTFTKIADLTINGTWVISL